ncbi:filamentous hemagglutinin N-terminal domain-containing protein [Limnohabitans sp. Hippo3]|uniref:two-partner secretion domain-containing protein n=1 Tax=Limnohabitans sp. Hippo3 TaxID=1597956 RepID=UPI000D38B5EA|nr:filamentous hemagglutinin N-terminal domain-containing protein [Limnohabitans sp. Hippo3]PUE38400.1 hypothetical protein B9Z34_11940 [Limnohabitans sp. Hippo3]
MNKTFHSIWNDITGTFVAVAETVSGCGKRTGSSAVTVSPSQAGSARRRRLLLTPLALALMGIGLAHATTALPAPAPNQLPTGGRVVAGQASVVQSGAALNVNQTSHRAVVDWNSFNVGASASVNFVQPSANSTILNRVLDANPSQIMGRINANGQVFLTNASGIYFGKNATINVGAFTATTHSIGNDDFMAGRLNFSRNGSTGRVVNEGHISADLGGYVALLAPEVRNQGVVVAQAGTVALAAGEVFELQFDGSRLTNIRVEPATIAALVENGNAVHAPGGLIILSAQAASRLQGGVVNNTGRLEAGGLVNDGGTVRLTASDSIRHSGSITADAKPESTGNGGSVVLIADLNNLDSRTQVSGAISARAGGLGGDGGFVETSASHVDIAESFQVSTKAPSGRDGLWLIDPVDITIDSSLAATIDTALDNGNVTISTTGSNTPSTVSGESGSTGNITVNSAITWAANKLTLNAANNIVFKANLNGSGTASLALEYGQATANGGSADYSLASGVSISLPAGDNFSTKLGSTGATQTFKVITSLGDPGSITEADLQGMNGGLSRRYALGADIHASTTSTWNSGAGFTPIGSNWSNQFTGVFEGLGHTINGLIINRGGQDYVGLFGNVSNATVRNLGLSNATITGRYAVGGLVGVTDGSSSITNSYVSASSINGLDYSTGGLVGDANYSSIQDSYAHAVTVKSKYGGAGGLVGFANTVDIRRSYSTGTVDALDMSDTSSSTSAIGGLVGEAFGNVNIVNSWSSVAVSLAAAGSRSVQNVGGLVGSLTGNSTIQRSFASGNVLGESRVGGLVGNSSGGAISDSYATGNVIAVGNTGGGLVGYGAFGSISRSYAVGTVTGGTFLGGLIGDVAIDIYNTPPLDWAPAITHSFYNSQVNVSSMRGYGDGRANSPGVVYGMSTADLKSQINFTSATSANGNSNPGWDFTSGSGVWAIQATTNNGYPCLVGVSCISSTPIYLRLVGGSSYYGDTPTLSYALYDASAAGSLVSDASPTGTPLWSTVLSSSSNASTYSLTYLSGISLGNSSYTLNAGSAVNWTINQRPLTVSAEAKNKTYGEANPALTYTVAADGVGTSRGLVNGDTLSGSLSTMATDTSSVGTYTIDASALTNTNYLITANNGVLTVSRRALTASTDRNIPVVPPIPQVTTAAALPSSAPPFSVTASVEQLNDAPPAPPAWEGVSVTLKRPASEQQSGLASVVLPKKMVDTGQTIVFFLPTQILQQKNAGAAVKVSLENGLPLPSWLRFDANTGAFNTLGVPGGALPVNVKVTVGQVDTIFTISTEAQ